MCCQRGKEYYYQAQGQIALSASTDHVMALRTGKITQIGFDQLTQGGPEHAKPELPLQDDEKKVKT